MALVAALAAISVAAVAFSPIPNVVPTTDITLVAGCAGWGAGLRGRSPLGTGLELLARAGAVDPVAMAGWGMTGLLGAWLATVTGRHVGRFGLAAVCAFAGFAYGALLDFSLMVTYGGEQSLDRFLAISARGVPFNIAHAAGNAALALVAGPAMVRMLLRYRSRFEFAWKGRGRVATAGTSGAAAGAACLIAVLLVVSSGVPGERADAAGGGPARALPGCARQNDDGGFGFAAGEESSPAMTGWAALGLESAGVNPLDLDHGDATPISYLAGNVGEITTTGDIERTILVLRGAGLDPRHFQGRDLVSRLLARRGKDGSWGGQVNQTAFGILPAGCWSDERHRPIAGWLRDHQNSDGGWGFAAAAASDADTTGAVLQGLAASGSSTGIRGALVSPQRPAARRRLPAERRRDQRPVHGVRGQGLVAAGVSPSSVREGGRSRSTISPPCRPATATTGTPHRATRLSLGHRAGSARSRRRCLPPRAVPRQGGRRAPCRPRRRGSSQEPIGARASKPDPKKKVAASDGTQPAAQPSPPSVPLAHLPPRALTMKVGAASGWVIVVAAAVLAAAAVWGGWVLYRRRLPANPGGPSLASLPEVEEAIRTRRTHKAYRPEPSTASSSRRSSTPPAGPPTTTSPIPGASG